MTVAWTHLFPLSGANPGARPRSGTVCRTTESASAFLARSGYLLARLAGKRSCGWRREPSITGSPAALTRSQGAAGLPGEVASRAGNRFVPSDAVDAPILFLTRAKKKANSELKTDSTFCGGC